MYLRLDTIYAFAMIFGRGKIFVSSSNSPHRRWSPPRLIMATGSSYPGGYSGWETKLTTLPI
jgi:hypothetical protein